MSILATTLVAQAAKKFALPMLAKFIEARLGAKAGDVAETVGDNLLDAIAKRAGVEVDNIDALPEQKLKEAMVAVEVHDGPEIVELALKSQEASHSLMIAEMEKGSWWTWAWRPLMMYLIMIFWLWSVMLVPIINSVKEDYFPVISFDDLLRLTVAYLTLYMGGHTLKSILKK